MDDLVQFLKARLDEDEALAWGVEDQSAPWTGQWVPDGTNTLRTRNGHVLAYGHETTDSRALPMPLKPGLVEHWARHDPARVLAEVEAKRRILECHEPWVAGNSDTICGRCGREHIDGRPGGHYPCQTLRLLALPYADHPDYREEWRP